MGNDEHVVDFIQDKMIFEYDEDLNCNVFEDFEEFTFSDLCKLNKLVTEAINKYGS